MELTALNKVLFVDKETVITAEFLNHLQAIIEEHKEAIVLINEKADAIRVYEIEDINGLQEKLETFATIESVEVLHEALEDVAQKAHKHEISDVRGLTEALEGFVSEEELEAVRNEIKGKSDEGHQHSVADILELGEKLATFLTEEAVLELLAGYINDGDLSQVVDSLTSAIETKAEKSHAHEIEDINGLVARLASFITSEDLPGLLPEVDLSDIREALSTIQNELLGKASVEHRHEIEDINGLIERLESFVTSEELPALLPDVDLTDIHEALRVIQEELTRKASSGHTHEMSDINGLIAALSEFVTNTALLEQLQAKANVEHIHSILAIHGLTEALAERYTKEEVDALVNEVSSNIDFSELEANIKANADRLAEVGISVEELTEIITDFSIVEINDEQEASGTVWSSAKTKSEIVKAVEAVDVVIDNATTKADGLMSKEDKAKLDSINTQDITSTKDGVESLKEVTATQAQELATVKETLSNVDVNAPRIYAQAEAPKNPIAGTIWVKTAE